MQKEDIKQNFETIINSSVESAISSTISQEAGNENVVILDVSNINIDNSELIITHWSSGLSFGVIYNKPIMLVTSNELINNERFTRLQIQFSKELGSEIINIDSKISEENLKKSLIIDKTKYNDYFLNYCSSRVDKKRNYQLISDIIKNKYM